MLIPFLLLTVTVVLIFAGCQVTRAGYETAPYRVLRTDGKFELRDYPAMTVVETPMIRSQNGSDGSFMRLFRFITGGNTAKQKIAMTTPVFMTGDETNSTMAFVLPAKLKTGEVPKPTDAAVSVRELSAGQFAVLRFRGGRSSTNETAALEKLKAWMSAAGLKTNSPPVFGYFDPPWTPTFLRRNEAMLRAEPATK
jgi:hypothetical protein